MDERDLSDPVVREGESVEKAPEAAREGITSDDLLRWSQEWNADDEELFPEFQLQETEGQNLDVLPKEAAPALDTPEVSIPEGETGGKIPEAPHLWFQPDDLQQEEVKAQEALMREVVSLMMPASDVIAEENAAYDIALLPADEISRMDDLAQEIDLAQDLGLELGDD